MEPYNERHEKSPFVDVHPYMPMPVTREFHAARESDSVSYRGAE